ncbi:hypothetical protein KI811_15455 [Geobacter hydrogenophilus]|uniref:Uncharacterized protein n=1 Tax=Geobacter hydrogenophilus TaxID=40983 RepID=A0A9W6L9N2_9BACT|nr:hypothetical protein [Geobacter hydrogenophilus]MBT0895206.1 hypothetical protein [Geobacter hydrogenophilus]GLI36612.1 hypothetical protein GHYDROH2_01130 [Geobacter hydrogenophilus]
MKVKILTVCVAVSLMGAGSAFAAYTAADSNGTKEVGTTIKATLKFSANVTSEYKNNTDGTAYVIGTSHTSGTKTYASSSGDTRIFMAEGKETTTPAAPASSDASANFDSTWTPVK